MKALKPYSTTNCAAHRLNNVLKTGFYHVKKKKSKKDKAVPAPIIEITDSSDSTSDSDEYEEYIHNNDDDKEIESSNGGKKDDKCFEGDQFVYYGKGSDGAVSLSILDYCTIKLPDIPAAALNFLKIIQSCKSLVRSVKKVRIWNTL